MRAFDCDLHLHSPFSGGTSKNMLLPVLGEQAKAKGLGLMASGDVLNREWLDHLKKCLVEENGCFKERESGSFFVLSGELNDSNNVHHIFFLPDFSAVEELREKLKVFGRLDGFGFGRPRLKASAERIAEIVSECNGIIGAAHAFTPYFSLYAHFDSLKDCYGNASDLVGFIELGLSADSFLADLIAENHKVSFLTCSDAHSPWPHRIGREFTRIEMKKPGFAGLKKALLGERKRIVLNAGLDPRAGKYHCSACNKCFTRFSAGDSVKLKFKCLRCGGMIKKGVRDRIFELASFKEEVHPDFRPDYLHIIPLAEIIRLALGIENVNAEKVQSLWRALVSAFGSEISVLVDVPIIKIAELNESVAEKIESFRKKRVLYISGGGGNYGQQVICGSVEEMERKKIELHDELGCRSSFKGQKTLSEF